MAILFMYMSGACKQPAPLGDCEHREGVRHGFRADCRAFERIDRDVDLGTFADADLLADVEHRRLVHLAFADDDGAPDLDAPEFPAHCVDGGLVGSLFVAAPAQLRGCDRRRFRHARDFEHQNALKPRTVLPVRLIDAVHVLPFRAQQALNCTEFYSSSMRIICGRSVTLPSFSMVSSALRIASSVVSCVMMMTG